VVYWQMLGSRWRWVVAAVALGCAASGASLARAGLAGATPSLELGHPRALGFKLSRSLVQSFAVFRRSTATHGGSKTPRLPSSIAASWTAPDDRYGIDLAATREVSVTSATVVWLAPGSSGACIAWDTTAPGAIGGGVCGPTATTTAGGLFGLSLRETGRGRGPSPTATVTLSGLAPDGNDHVSIVAADDARRQVRVVDNVYTWAGSGMPKSLSVRDASGHVHTYTLTP
jgi:hypothetical protein